jgi:hypothetical protein
MIKIAGVQMGNLTGGPSSLNLYELHDVSITTPLTGQYLRYNSTISEWQNSYLNTDVYNYIAASLSGTQGVSITAASGPETFTVGLGNITPTSVSSSGTVTGSNISGTSSGTNTGDQTITLTSDVTGSGTGSFATTLATVNVSPQTDTFRKITVNGKGLVTATSAVQTSDLSAVLGYTPGAGTVSTVSVTTANGVSGSVATATTTPAITLTLGAITPSSVAATGTVTGTNLSGSSSGTNTGDQTITLTGDITGSGTSSFATTLATVNLSPQTDTFRKITVNGKGLLTASTAVSASDITTALTYTPVNKAGDTMTGLLVLSADPAVALGAATKQYVDTVATGLAIHQSAVAGTTVNLTATYNNGAAGVGATLTNSTTQAALVIDTVTLAVNDRVLVKNQSTQYENGIYVVTDVGSGSTNWVLTRSADFDNSPPGEITAGDSLFITSGSQTATQWVQITTGIITVGTTAIVFTQFGGPGTYSAGTGINISSNIVSNTGVTSAVAGTNIAVSSATGAVTFSVTGTVSSATTATNLASGAANSIPYQTGSGATTFLAQGTGVLQEVAGAPSWTTTPTLTGTNFTGIPNGALTNSSLTLGSTSMALGSTTTTVAGLISVTSTTFVGALTGAASLNVLKTGDTMSGSLTATAFNATSTARVKDAIVDIGQSYLTRFMDMKPREYNRTDMASKHEFGFIAEEMVLVYPEVVATDTAGQVTGIDYGKLSTILTAKVQEQQAVIDKLQTQVAKIMEMLKGAI